MGGASFREPAVRAIHERYCTCNRTAPVGLCQGGFVPDSPPLTHHGNTMTSVFSLLGSNENDLTAALGWALRSSPRFLAAITGTLDPPPQAETTAIDLEVSDDAGRTDLELHGSDHVVVIEAKRGWLLPTVTQLETYASRCHMMPVAHLVTLSDCSADWAGLQLPASVNGVKVTHLPWSVVGGLLAGARRGAAGHERLWLDQLDTYLKETLRVVEVNNAEAYCVVINNERPGGGGPHTYREIVEQGFYYYPCGWGRGWPRVPPNFLAFRWDNHVQHVHRVLDYEVIASLQERWPDIPAPKGDGDEQSRTEGTDRPHVLCRLGPALRMEPLPTGKNYRAGRMWVLLDQLFTAPTLQEALRGSQQLRGELPLDEPPTTT